LPKWEFLHLDWPFFRLGRLLDWYLLRRIGDVVLELCSWHLFCGRFHVLMHALRAGYLSAQLGYGLLSKLCVGELLRFHRIVIGDRSLLGWHLLCRCVERVLKLRRGILLYIGSVKLHELRSGYRPNNHEVYKLFELRRWEILGIICFKLHGLYRWYFPSEQRVLELHFLRRGKL